MRDADITRKHKNLVYVQTLKLLQTTGRPKAPKRQVAERQAGPRRAAAAAALGEQGLMHPPRAKRRRARPVKDRRDDARHRRRDPREVPGAGDPRAEPDQPRDPGVPALPARQTDAGARLGPPQADVFMLKQAPSAAEIEEGVAFYGRAGNALMKSFKRLGIDPLVVYGTLCVKCPIADPDLAAGECVARLVEELAIVQPKIVVVMGEPNGGSARPPTPRRSSVNDSSDIPPRSDRGLTIDDLLRRPMNRRQALKRAGAAGVALSGFSVIAAACGSSSNANGGNSSSSGDKSNTLVMTSGATPVTLDPMVSLDGQSPAGAARTSRCSTSRGRASRSSRAWRRPTSWTPPRTASSSTCRRTCSSATAPAWTRRRSSSTSSARSGSSRASPTR